jgi:hypothetical protein
MALKPKSPTFEHKSAAEIIADFLVVSPKVQTASDKKTGFKD